METNKQRAGDGAHPLVLRWSPAQIERAASIVNDITENIDNGEGRAELRQALACYADQLMWLREEREATRTDKLIAEMEKLNARLAQNAPRQFPARSDNNLQAEARP